MTQPPFAESLGTEPSEQLRNGAPTYPSFGEVHPWDSDKAVAALPVLAVLSGLLGALGFGAGFLDALVLDRSTTAYQIFGVWAWAPAMLLAAGLIGAVGGLRRTGVGPWLTAGALGVSCAAGLGGASLSIVAYPTVPGMGLWLSMTCGVLLAVVSVTGLVVSGASRSTQNPRQVSHTAPFTAEQRPLAQPYVGQPYASQPYASQPYASQPYAEQPYAEQPYVGQSYGAQPYSGQPFAEQPYRGQAYAAQSDGGPSYSAPDYGGPGFPGHDLVDHYASGR
ncbi:hypothetical protein EH165_11195 [Nakamurella antarctica]|uniref:Uncharacterized protein n=1 Tax=Nakamurella antarctica TaxID=1902245 RepID=A0A3G8ZVY1_9ACTN|nr:DUF5336 domain-containing protein [Nakamurella antarctica]AZI58614.1 hypothetical protein EH165_11195 [Nakamurella antarctica]